MSNTQIVYITAEGLQKIKDELTHLKTVKRPEVSNRLELAIAEGDISENADYDYAKQEQAFIEGRILDLEDSLRRAQIIEHDGSTDIVKVGSYVTVVEDGFSEPERYQIVGVHEADPTNGRISNESPMGQALLGGKRRQKVKVKTPDGEIIFRIKSISTK